MLHDGATPLRLRYPPGRRPREVGLPPSRPFPSPSALRLTSTHPDLRARLAAASETSHRNHDDPSIHQLSPASYVGPSSHVRDPPTFGAFERSEAESLERGLLGRPRGHKPEA